MLDLGENAGGDVGIAIAGDAAAGGAKTGEVVLFGINVAPAAVARAVGQKVGLHRHLEEGVVPPHAPDLTVLLVVAGDVGEARIEVRIARLDEGHEALGRHTTGHGVVSVGTDAWRCGKRGNGGYREQSRHRQRQSRHAQKRNSSVRRQWGPHGVATYVQTAAGGASREFSGAAINRRARVAQPSGQSSKALLRALFWVGNEPTFSPPLA